MQVTRYEPWTLLKTLNKDLNRLSLFDQLINEGSNDDATLQSGWIPAVDIKEEEQQFVIHADLPGIDPKEIEITAEDNVLTIQGSRRAETEQKKDAYTRRERSYGHFYRSFTLPDNANTDAIEAKGNNGVLEIILPKQAEKQARRITVKS